VRAESHRLLLLALVASGCSGACRCCCACHRPLCCATCTICSPPPGPTGPGTYASHGTWLKTVERLHKRSKSVGAAYPMARR
jgi:hypothetical protein